MKAKEDEGYSTNFLCWICGGLKVDRDMKEVDLVKGKGTCKNCVGGAP